MRRLAVAAGLLLAAACSQDAGYAYTRCAATSECGSGATCLTITWRDGSGAMCTAGCVDERSCPRGGRCLDVVGAGTYVCLPPCVTDPDCNAGLICQPLTLGGAVCLPM